MSYRNAVEMLELYDKGKISNIALMTGLYFKRRETAVYATILQGLKKRKQRYAAFKNHAKIILMAAKSNFITIEGSANFTGNPRLEQYVLTNDKILYEFHRHWMESILK